MKTIMIFSDMDGCIAKWNQDASIEDTYEKDYFRQCEIDEEYKQGIDQFIADKYKIMATNNYDVTVRFAFLSAVYGDEQALAKRDWLNDHGYKNVPLITVPYGVCKREYLCARFPESVGDVNILIDDYTKNLQSWNKNDIEMNFTGIKYLNGINHTNQTWQGVTMDADAVSIYNTLNQITEYFAEAFNFREEFDTDINH